MLFWAWGPLTCFALWAVYHDPSAVLTMAVSPDGTRVAVSRIRPHGTELEIWSTEETPRIVRRIPLSFRTRLAFLDDHRILVGTGFHTSVDDYAYVMDVESSQHLWQFPAAGYLYRVESGKGRFLMDDGTTARVYDADSYQELTAVTSEYKAHLSPDGKLLAIANLDGWRFVSIDTGNDVLNAPADTMDGCFSADGRAFVCSSESGLVAIDLAADSQAGAAKSKGQVGSFYTQSVISTDHGIVFLDESDGHLKIWENGKNFTRTLFPAKFDYVDVISVGDSKIWIGESSGYLRSLDLLTGEVSSPLQLPLRVYASGLWLLWCMAWFVMQTRQVRGGEDIGSPRQAGPLSFDGPALDLSLTLVPVIAYFAIGRHVGIWLTHWDMAVLYGVTAAVASAVVLWMGLGQQNSVQRLLWSMGGLATLLIMAQVDTIGYDEVFSAGVGLWAAAVTWLVYRRRARWRLARSGPSIASAPKESWRWSIRDLLLTTTVCAVIVRAAIDVDIDDLFRPFINSSSVSIDAILIYVHAVVPYVALFAPWSNINRFRLLCVLLVVYGGVWASSNDWLAWFVPSLASGTLAVCGIVWLHGYRFYPDRSAAATNSVVGGSTAEG